MKSTVSQGSVVRVRGGGAATSPDEDPREDSVPAALRVIVSHPAKQGNVYHRPRAAEIAGMDVRFLTGLYFRPARFPYFLLPWLPRTLRGRWLQLLQKRRIDRLKDGSVVSLLGPSLELALRPSGRFREWFNAHDWLASWWIASHRRSSTPTILHGFQASCVRTFRAGRSKGMIRVLEMTLPPILDAALLEGVVEEPGDPWASQLAAEIKEADFVLAQSEYSARTAIALGAHREQIVRVHLGVDTDCFRPREHERMPGPVRILFLGGTSRRKGIHHLLEAWGTGGIPGAELSIAGNRTSRIDAPPIEDFANCRLVGFIPENRFTIALQNADILVNPSLSEGGSNVIYEALACGLPCIASCNAGSAVRNGIEGFVVGVGDIPALRSAMQGLCLDSRLRERMGRAARERAESLSWDRYAENLAAVYRSLAHPSKARELCLNSRF